MICVGAAVQDIFLSGSIFTPHYEDGEWVTCTGYYSGHFTKPWLGIRPTGALAHLRVGEFHRMLDGRVVESYIYLDIPELMIAAGQWPISDSPGKDRGFTGYLPGPLTQDGLQWHENDALRSSSGAVAVVVRRWDRNIVANRRAFVGVHVALRLFGTRKTGAEKSLDLLLEGQILIDQIGGINID